MANINANHRVFEEGGTLTIGADTVLNVIGGTLKWTPGLWEAKELTDRGALKDSRLGSERPTKVEFSVRFTSMVTAGELYKLLTTKGTSGVAKQFSIVAKFKDHIDATTGEQITFAKCVLEADGLSVSAGTDFDTLSCKFSDLEANPATVAF